MHIPEGQRRRDFSIWLRTGRWPRLSDSRASEFKFNPWHDPKDGRFTFNGAGRFYGPGGTRRVDGQGQGVPKISYAEDLRLPPISTREEVEAWRAEQLSKNGRRPGYRDAIEAQYRRYLDKLASRSDSPEAIEKPLHLGGRSGRVEGQPTRFSEQGGFRGGGGGSFGGGGASGSWEWPSPKPDPFATTAELAQSRPGESASVPAARFSGAASEPRHIVVRNGYTYEIDARARTRRVSGVLSNTDTPVRSRSNQAHAGGEDRRASDDGGHYIAARFDGPRDAFNHFAQDANFNRGRYRALEDQWARAKRMGKRVTVAIVPRYHEGSTRPFEIDLIPNLVRTDS